MILDTRWISGASGLLLGTDLSQTDIQAEYSCLALDVPSSSLRLTTDGTLFSQFIEITCDCVTNFEFHESIFHQSRR